AVARLAELSGAFSDLLNKRFGDWDLTAAERDVALFAIKGMTTREIADLRNTSEGTVKAQCNAIYRKAGVSNRYQLVSLFVEELIELPLDKR
ncbi:MAG: helix-turn-helix domain-containing protein, partial [Rhizobiaceae bacterium]